MPARPWLVILGVGLEAGVISPALFSMMVLMAVVTTLMTTPLLHWIQAPALEAHPAARARPNVAGPASLETDRGLAAGKEVA